MEIQTAIARVVSGQHLSQEESHGVMGQIMSGGATDAQIGAFITALRCKGETVEEIAGAAQAMREKALPVRAEGIVIDTCGTGGDGSGTFNISTTAAFVVAACGATVAKHGNRSISSKSGSADVLKSLGVNLDAEMERVQRCLAQAGIAFLFAPRHHGAMKHAAGPRKEIGIRTVFNLLGPLTNPAGAKRQLLGVFAAAWTEPLARVLGRLGSERAMVVHGCDGLDEITTTGNTRVSHLYEDGRVETGEIDPRALGITLAAPRDLAGGDAAENAAITRAILAGENGPRRDIVLVNAAAAVWVAGLARSLEEGLGLAARALDSGEALRRLEKLVALTN